MLFHTPTISVRDGWFIILVSAKYEILASCVFVVFVSDSKKMATELEEIVAGRVSFIEVLLEYRTLTEDAVNSRLFLSLPPNLLGAPQSIQDTTGNVRLCISGNSIFLSLAI